MQQVALRHPDLINTDGSLRDPTRTLTSTADVSALAIGEWGMALGKAFEFWGQPVSLGITPKLMRVDAYRDNANFNSPESDSIDDSLDQFADSKTTHVAFNADVGIAAIFADHYRIGLAVKDAFAKNFRSHQNDDPVTGLPHPDLLIKLHPRSRMGLGYINEYLSLGLDYDLQESKPMANEAPSQNISFGAEYWVTPGWTLRMGYRQDQAGLRDSATSAGIGYQWRRFVAEVAYAKGEDSEAGGLQLGWAF
jgi:predicted porin